MPSVDNQIFSNLYTEDSLVAQTVKNPPAMQENRAESPGQEDPLEKVMATHSSILVWWIPWTEEPGAVQSMGLKRVRHDWVTFTLHWITSEVSAVPKCLEPWNLNIRAVVSLLLRCGMGSGWKHLDSVYRIWLSHFPHNFYVWSGDKNVQRAGWKQGMGSVENTWFQLCCCSVVSNSLQPHELPAM